MNSVVIKRVARLCLSILVLAATVLCAATPVLAAGAATPGQRGTLTIIYSNEGTMISGANILIFQVAAISKEELPRVKYKISSDFSGCRARVDKLKQAEDVSKNALLFFEWANTHSISSALCKNGTTDESGKTVFEDLEMGVYLVVQTGAQAGSRASKYERFNAFLMDVPHEGSTWDYKVVSEPKTRLATQETVSLNVEKRWENTPVEKMPESVSVQLFSDGSAYGEAVVLNAKNSWSHEWTNLSAQSRWTVDEVEVPQNFDKRVIYDHAGGAVIVNSYVGGGDEDEDDDKNGGKDAMAGGTKKANGTRPKTGDSNALEIYVLLAAVALFAILLLLIKKRKVNGG